MRKPIIGIVSKPKQKKEKIYGIRCILLMKSGI